MTAAVPELPHTRGVEHFRAAQLLIERWIFDCINRRRYWSALYLVGCGRIAGGESEAR